MANESIKFDLSLQEINIVLAALGELPAKTSLAVINKVQQQAQPQVVPEPIEEEGAEQPLFSYSGFVGQVILFGNSDC